MYRAVAYISLTKGIETENVEALVGLARSMNFVLTPSEVDDRLLVDGQDITQHLRGPEVQSIVSTVSEVPDVRSALIEQQRAMSKKWPIVEVGRDIGSVVLPNAFLKVYLTAPFIIRAQRRYRELQCLSDAPAYADVVADLTLRDKIDSERADSPLRPAEDAVIINTTVMGIGEVIDRIVCLVGLG